MIAAMVRTHMLALLMVAACGGDDSSVVRDGGNDTDAHPPDAPVDAPPPITTHRGLVQVVSIAGGNASVTAGFFSTPAGAPGCTWTFDGACSLAVCDVNAGLVAQSAGTLSIAIDGGTPVTVTVDGSNRYAYQSLGAVPAGALIAVSAPGGSVGAFTATPLAMPTPLAVSAPVANATVDRSQPLVFTWTAAAGGAYLNLSQESDPNSPYPATYRRTVRCDLASAQTGTATVPASMMSAFAPGMVLATLAGAALDTRVVGEYDVAVRLIAVDSVRMLTLQ